MVLSSFIDIENGTRDYSWTLGHGNDATHIKLRMFNLVSFSLSVSSDSILFMLQLFYSYTWNFFKIILFMCILGLTDCLSLALAGKGETQYFF